MYIMSINRLSQIYKKSNKHQIINGYHSKEKNISVKMNAIYIGSFFKRVLICPKMLKQAASNYKNIETTITVQKIKVCQFRYKCPKHVSPIFINPFCHGNC